jgi:hypothetical protein
MEHAPGEPGERREAHRAEDAVDVHVADAGIDLVAAVAHLPERHGVHAVLLGRSAGDRVQPEVRAALVAPYPHVGPVRCADHTGPAVAPPLGKVALEDVGRLDDVVVDADEDQIVDLHAAPIVTGSSFRRRCPSRCHR